MVNLLRALTVITLLGGFILGALAGNNVGDSFSVWTAVPIWFGGVASSAVFAALAEILAYVRKKTSEA